MGGPTMCCPRPTYYVLVMDKPTVLNDLRPTSLTDKQSGQYRQWSAYNTLKIMSKLIWGKIKNYFQVFKTKQKKKIGITFMVGIICPMG